MICVKCINNVRIYLLLKINMFYIVYPIFYLLSLIPFWIMYLISDVLYFLIYKIWGYRTQVVTHQLQSCFPEKSDEEIHSIVKQYYRNMCDQIVETIKIASMSEKELNKRFEVDYEKWMPYFLEREHLSFWTAHFFNFEWVNLSFQFKMKWLHEQAGHKPFEYYGVYSSLGSKLSDRIFRKLREKPGSYLVSTKEFVQALKDHKPMNAMGLIADQSPLNVERSFWIDFFGINTPFFSLPEKVAQDRNLTVVYAQVTKLKRGYYRCEMSVLTEEPQELQRGQLTKMYAERLESEIKKQTPLWMWSHRRWKRKYQESYSANRIS